MSIKTKTPSGQKFYQLQLSGIPISISVAKAALSNIRGIKRLLRKEESWVKEAYTDNTKEQPRYCLIGAKREVDGKGEHLADTILQQCISGEKLVKEEFLSEDFKRQFLDGYEDFSSIVLEEKTGLITFDTDEDAEAVQSFNDARETTFADIHLFLDYCIAQTEKLVARLSAQRDKAAAKKASGAKSAKKK